MRNLANCPTAFGHYAMFAVADQRVAVGDSAVVLADTSFTAFGVAAASRLLYGIRPDGDRPMELLALMALGLAALGLMAAFVRFCERV